MFKNLTYLSLCFCVLVPSQAFAIQKKIISPNVTKGQWEVENFGTVGHGDDGNEWENTTELEYGLTDRIKIELAVEIEKENDEALELEESEVEVLFKLTGQESLIKSAIQLEYEFNHLGGADEAAILLALEKVQGLWKHRANVQFSHEVGDEKRSGVSTGLSLGSYYSFDKFKLGGEYYADFGNLRDNLDYSEQEHNIGPVIGFDIPLAEQKLEAKVGYLAGISDAATDHVFKYELELEF